MRFFLSQLWSVLRTCFGCPHAVYFFFDLLLKFLTVFRNAEFSENSLYRKLKKKDAKRNGKNRFVFLLLSLQFKYFIISSTTYFFMSFVIKIIIIKPLIFRSFFWTRDPMNFRRIQVEDSLLLLLWPNKMFYSAAIISALVLEGTYMVRGYFHLHA